jgi:molecular chaperone GrpE
MAVNWKPKDQPSRDGGEDHPTDEQLEGATADGAPTPPNARDRALGEGAMSDESSAELAEERDRNLRLRAELENVRSRASRELADQSKYASLALARDLLPVLDNIDRAIESAEKNHDAGALLEGFKLVKQQLVTALKQHHIQEVAAAGAEFDPQFHAAILQQPSPDVPANHVSLVAQAGYQMHDRVVRPAQVIVSSGPAG